MTSACVAQGARHLPRIAKTPSPCDQRHRTAPGPLFSSLPDAEATALAARLADVRLREGDWLLQEGEQASFFMLIDGEIEVRKVVHGTERQINIYRPGEYFGELPLLLGAPAVASLRALQPSRVAQLDPGDFSELFGACTTFSAELMQTMTQRFSRLRTLMSEMPPPRLTIVGHRYDVACHQLRDFMVRNRMTFRWLDPTRPTCAARPRLRGPEIDIPWW